MANEADVGFMTKAFESSGTISNALALLELEKKIFVYVGTDRRFETLRSMEDLDRLVSICSEEYARKTPVMIFDKKFNMSNRLHKKPEPSVQLEMFPG